MSKQDEMGQDDVEVSRRAIVGVVGSLGAVFGLGMLAGCEALGTRAASLSRPDPDDGTSALGQALTGATTLRWVDTLAEMISAAPGDPVQCLMLLKGYHAVGDGGGGLFHWTNDTIAAHDGALVVVPSAMPRTGCWKRFFGLGPRMLDVRWFGAKLDGVADDAPAIQKAIRAVWAANPSVGFRGDTVYIPFGRARIGSTIVVDRACVLAGAGGSPSYAATELLVNAEISPAIRIVTNTASGSGQGAVIRDLKLLTAAPSTTLPEVVGILVNNNCRISNICIGSNAQRFDAAIVIRGSTGDSPVTNANGWFIDKVFSIGNKIAVRVTGNNANAGVATGVVAVAPSGSPEWLFDDDTLHGNTYIACHASGAASPGGGFRCGFTSPPNRSTYFGCYNEGGTTNSFGVAANVIGGTVAFDAGGTSIVAQVANRLQIGDNASAQKFSPYRRLFYPKQWLEAYSHKSTPEQTPGTGIRYNYVVRKSSAFGDGVDGWYLHQYTGPPLSRFRGCGATVTRM
ncbi:MAG: glycosyl hydrolase family 28-related protein [Chromatiales bacterium]